MSSLVYYKFKSQSDVDCMPFEGFEMSVDHFVESLRTKCGFKSNSYELEVYRKNGEKCEPSDFIRRFETVIIKRVPSKNGNKKISKTTHNENFKKSDPYINRKEEANIVREETKNELMNLAYKDISDDAKMDIITEYSSRFTNLKMRPRSNIPPPNYLCNRCNQPGHFIYNCPGIKDKNGKLLDYKKVKRPSGIPLSGLKEVDENTPNSYLTLDGKYVVNIKNYEAALIGKKEKRPFSKEENPPVMIESVPETIKCSLCQDVMVYATKTPCCNKSYCYECILDRLFNSDKFDHCHQCPNCLFKIDKYDELINDSVMQQIINKWNNKEINSDQLDQYLRDGIKTEAEPKQLDLMDEFLFMSDKENVDNIENKDQVMAASKWDMEQIDKDFMHDYCSLQNGNIDINRENSSPSIKCDNLNNRGESEESDYTKYLRRHNHYRRRDDGYRYSKSNRDSKRSRYDRSREREDKYKYRSPSKYHSRKSHSSYSSDKYSHKSRHSGTDRKYDVHKYRRSDRRERSKKYRDHRKSRDDSMKKERYRYKQER